MIHDRTLSLFDAYGIELEYMLVDRETLDVRAVADRVLTTAAGKPSSDVEFGDATYSNELALHVLELKGTRPTPDLNHLNRQMQQAIQQIQPALSTHGAMLLPGGMHPWMDPKTETRLWPHECSEIYQAYDRVFDCHRHGWANVQSVHLNLPFDGDDQFARLHAAVRLILPLLPAIAASSPIVEGRPAAWADMRMHFVRDHCEAVPFLTGQMVPEAIFDEATYRREIFTKLQQAIGGHDPDGVFECDFLNARGAIARFDRGSIEIRVMDVQEYPGADLAICQLVIDVLKSMVDQKWSTLADQQAMPTPLLSGWLDRISQSTERTVIDDPTWLRHFGVSEPSIQAGEVWKRLANAVGTDRPELDPILTQGTLSTRILSAVNQDWRREHITEVYRRLGDCLAGGQPFLP
ncbi:Carboxylate-amine ligase YbdK [Rubripirellula lacrimiformis]|uniref:Carboxylate-amine ligase YbdK n=1 Tax=Rubripirellula lacrimiformis TaxID=1930273 RepID=A0A517NGG5_9BACT|nr:glutamate-cysteine ligase family protein [Rubripirellula lacrimiformis]QDT06222.1 Carboxylate-amine ligase YbdK [Rubripirellula lacrimiformis]